jgi:type III secretion protein L
MDKRKSTLAAAITALRAFRHAQRLVVRVPPEAVEWIDRGLDQALEPALRALLVIQPDPRLKDGRCVVVTEFGIVEAGIEEQIAALRSGLLGQDHRGDV